MRVPLVYLPCCPVPNCLGKQGELSRNCLPNLTVSFCHLVFKLVFIVHLRVSLWAEDGVEFVRGGAAIPVEAPPAATLRVVL